MTTLQEAAQYRSLYELTGDIKDFNTMLVPRTALAQQGELAEQMVSNTAMDYQLRALDVCREAKKVSVSLVQRKLGLSYAAAQELCQSIVASGLVPGLPIAPSLIDVMAALTAGRATLAGAERVEFVDLKEQARRGCGNCFYQDCDYPNCITKRKPV